MADQETIQGATPQIAAPPRGMSALRACRIALSLFFTVILLALLINAMLTVFLPHYYPKFGRYRLFAIASDSMEPGIPTGNMIVDKVPASRSEIEIGTVITFEVNSGKNHYVVYTHRVENIVEKDGKTIYVTKGDNAPFTDNFDTEYENIIGIYTGKQCKFFGYFFEFIKSEEGMIMLITIIFIITLSWIVLTYINSREKYHELETGALKKSATELSNVNLRYDNIREITAVLDVLSMVTDEPKTRADERNIEERLRDFIAAESIELPQTPETAAILDSLPAPDTPFSLASALRSGATLRQAEDGQTLVLTGISGGKSILLTPVQTPDGIILCQQGVRLRTDIAPNIENVGATSMPEYPEFFEGQPLKKNVAYPELPQPKDSALGAEMFLPHNSYIGQDGNIPQMSTPRIAQSNTTPQVAGLVGSSATPPAASVPASAAPATSAPPMPEPEQYRAKVAYAQYRELAAQLEIRQTEQLNALLNSVSPISPDDKARVDAYRKANPPRPRKKRTPEQIAAQKERAAKRQADQEAFIKALSPADRELYLSEQKLSRSRAATIRRLRKIASDNKILGKLKDDDTDK